MGGIATEGNYKFSLNIEKLKTKQYKQISNAGYS